MRSQLDGRRMLQYQLSAWLPVALAVCVIALESTDLFSYDHTSGPLRWVCESLFGAINDDTWGTVHVLIRKSGHFFGYGIIGLVWLRAWKMTLPRFNFFQDAFLALLGTALVGGADEFHQTLIPSRTGTPWDVLIDCSGAVVLQLIVYLYLRLRWPNRLEKPA